MSVTTLCSSAACTAPPSTKLTRCSRCRVARYCSVACQRAHWPTHKGVCMKSDLPAWVEELEPRFYKAIRAALSSKAISDAQRELHQASMVAFDAWGRGALIFVCRGLNGFEALLASKFCVGSLCAGPFATDDPDGTGAAGLRDGTLTHAQVFGLGVQLGYATPACTPALNTLPLLRAKINDYNPLSDFVVVVQVDTQIMLNDKRLIRTFNMHIRGNATPAQPARFRRQFYANLRTARLPLVLPLPMREHDAALLPIAQRRERAARLEIVLRRLGAFDATAAAANARYVREGHVSQRYVSLPTPVPLLVVYYDEHGYEPEMGSLAAQLADEAIQVAHGNEQLRELTGKLEALLADDNVEDDAVMAAIEEQLQQIKALEESMQTPEQIRERMTRLQKYLDAFEAMLPTLEGERREQVLHRRDTARESYQQCEAALAS